MFTDKLSEKLLQHPSAPFLFVGSGFSRRYLGLEDWGGLLARFCSDIKSFRFYSSSCNEDMPKVASMMALDFNEWFWNAEESFDLRQEFQGEIQNNSDALKYCISRYIGSKGVDDARLLPYFSELANINGISVDGIITTNWDGFLEYLFPDYRPFIGQDGLLFSNPQSIGEIYKIHGCSSEPKSLVLTSDDYSEFSRRNPYLAAKLVTIFVEHPIVFIGYSLSDPHIRDIIVSIAKCLNGERMSQFENNLFFVERCEGLAEDEMSTADIHFDEHKVSMTVLKTDDFSKIYEAISTVKRKIPARLVRFFKEQMYSLTKDPSEIEKKIAVIDADALDNMGDVEFVIGIGVAKSEDAKREIIEARAQDSLSRQGYVGLSADDLLKDVLKPTSHYDAVILLKHGYPAFGRSARTFTPVFRYLRDAGVDDAEKLNASSYEGAKRVVEKLNKADFSLSGYASRYNNTCSNLSSEEIVAKSDNLKDALLMLCCQKEGFDVEQAIDFLLEKETEFDLTDGGTLTAYRKLVCRCDKVKYGF